MKADRFDYAVWGLAAILALAIGGLLLAARLQGAGVAGVTPPAGTAVSARGPISITFAQPMQQESAEAAFRLTPTAAGTFSWQGDTLRFHPSQPLDPEQNYTAILAAGALAADGRRTRTEHRWPVAVRQPELIYLTSNAAPREVARQAAAAGAEPTVLTNTGGQVFDFAVSPDGEWLAYSVVNDERGIDLWLLPLAGGTARRFQNCGPGRCTTPAFSPDGLRLAFSRAEAGLGPGEPIGPPRIWLADLTTGAAVRLFANTEKLGYGPVWSPDGARLMYWDGLNSRLVVVELAAGREISLPSVLGQAGSWSPDSNRLAYANLNLAVETPLAGIFLADLETLDILPLLEAGNLPGDYRSPAWSPDGEWLAAAVRTPDRNDEVWLLRPDGLFALAIATDPGYIYQGLAWDPWGRQLLFQRVALAVPFPPTETLVYDIASGETTILSTDTGVAGWLP